MTLKVGRSKQAKNRKLSQSTGYRVDVIGTTWAGYESTYTYTFPYLPDATKINLRAGDFQSVDDYQITAVTRVEYVDGHRVRFDVVCEWAKDDSADKFAEANNG